MSNFWRPNDETHWESHFIGDAPTDGESLGAPGLQLLRYGNGTDRGVALITRSGVDVLVNGSPVVGGLRVLEHKDEILVGRQRFFYSSESAPTLAIFRAEVSGRPTTCPVCRGVLKDGVQAVRCPGCGRWFHQIEPTDGQPARRCWTFAPTCRICNHPTPLTGEPVWTPEKEEGRD